jgi:twitching motility protein PilI
MSNKQALRELQQRLAQRMQAAREQTNVASWLAVECAGLGLLFPLKQAAEI